MRWPVTHSARSHQWVPMSAKAREGPPNPALTRQLAVSADSSQSCRYEPWTTWTAPSCPESTRARASCIIVWYRYASGTAAMTPARAAWLTRWSASNELVAKGFSQTTCLPWAMTDSARAQCRWFGTQIWTTSTSGWAISARASANCCSAPSSSPAWNDRSGVEATTPISRPPTMRTALACTRPMKPDPITPTPSGVTAALPPHVGLLAPMPFPDSRFATKARPFSGFPLIREPNGLLYGSQT
jgi:hypothetical protein